MATGRTNSGEVTITQSGGGSSDIQPRKIDYIWTHPKSFFRIYKDFLGWLNSGYVISIKYRLNTEYLNLDAFYTGILGCKFNDYSSVFSKQSYGYYIGNPSTVNSTSTYRLIINICANLSSNVYITTGNYMNCMLMLRVDNDVIQYKNCYSYDYSHETWTVPTNWSSGTIPDNNTFSSLLNIYDSITGLRDLFGYGSICTNTGSFYFSDAIIGDLKVINPSNNDEVIANYETWINNNKPYLKETVSNTTLNALFASTLPEADRFNGWIEYVTDENGIVTRKEVPPKKYVQTRGNIIYVDEVENGNNNNSR